MASSQSQPACLTCLSVGNGVCEECGEVAQARVDEQFDIVSFRIEAGLPCQACGTIEDLEFRRYRRVAGFLVFDRIWTKAGYYCAACRRRMFRRHIAFTLVCGWWGLFALWFRNPYAILVNLRALYAPPKRAHEYGAVDFNSLGSERRDLAPPLRPPVTKERRPLRRRWPILAGGVVVLASLATYAALSPSDGPRPDDAAPAAAVAAESAAIATATPTAEVQTIARGENGARTYSCPVTSLSEIDDADHTVKRRDRLLAKQQRQLDALDRDYPGHTAPAAVAQRYNALLAKARAQLKWTNRAVDAYNGLLVDLCEPRSS